MSWRDEKVDYLQKSRDFPFLHDDDVRGSRDIQRKKGKDAGVSDNQEARDRLLRLKALEKQRANKQKEQYVEIPSPERNDRNERQDMERNPGPSGSKLPPSKDNFGSFFGKVEKVVAKRVVDEKRAREIAAREARIAEGEKAAKVRVDSRNGFMRPPSNGSGSKPAAKLKPVNSVAVKAQKLKDNRDYSFLFSDDPPSKPGGADDRDSRAELSKASRDRRGSVEDMTKRKSMGTFARKPKAASNSAVRPGSGQALKASAIITRYDGEKSAERNVTPRRVGPASKSGLHERPPSRGVPSKLLVSSDRSNRDGQERAKSAGPKATNHERVVLRNSWSVKQSLATRAMQTSVQRISQSGNVRERMVQKSTTKSRALQSVQKGNGSDTSRMKKNNIGEAGMKVGTGVMWDDGRRVERSKYGVSSSESEMRRLVAGVPRSGASGGGRIAPASANGLKRKRNDGEDRRKAIGAPTRRPVTDEATRKPVGNECIGRKASDELRRRKRLSEELMESKPSAAKEKKRPREPESDNESDSNDGGGVRASGVSSIIQKLFRYNPNKYKDLDEEDDKNMETSFRHIQVEEKRSARLAREEDELEQELIEEEERQERLRRRKRQKSQ